MGHKVSPSSIPKLLESLKYCRHSNRKTKEGGKHPDRDAQFEYINAIEVNTHDFEDKELGKVVPYGVYDIGANDGYVSLGIDHDTAQFAVNSVRLWLDRIGRERYP